MIDTAEEKQTCYQNDKILDLSISKAFADDNLNVYQKLKFTLGSVENIVGKKEKMLVTSIFSFSHNVFKGFFSFGSLKVGIVW